MNYLVDTQVFLWVILSPKKITKRVKEILLDDEKTKQVSTVTFWEISLKFSLGKIDLKGILPDNLPAIADKTGFEILNLDAQTVSSFHRLPKTNHKDPFDRMLAWQAINQDCILLTSDKQFSSYKEFGLEVVW